MATQGYFFEKNTKKSKKKVFKFLNEQTTLRIDADTLKNS